MQTRILLQAAEAQQIPFSSTTDPLFTCEFTEASISVCRAQQIPFSDTKDPLFTWELTEATGQYFCLQKHNRSWFRRSMIQGQTYVSGNLDFRHGMVVDTFRVIGSSLFFALIEIVKILAVTLVPCKLYKFCSQRTKPHGPLPRRPPKLPKVSMATTPGYHGNGPRLPQ